MVTNFFSTISYAINLFTPKFYNHKSNYPPWYSKELKTLIFNKKKRPHKDNKITKDPIIYNEFSRIRALCKKESKICRNQYLRIIQLNFTTDPKSFWHYIKCLKLDNEISDTMEYVDKLSTGGYAVSNLFKDFFSNVYSNQSPNTNNCISDINDSLYTSNLASLKLLVEDVFQSLSTLYLNPCPGPDGIPNILLRSCKYSLAVPFHKLFCHLLSKGVFPFQWKNS